MCSHPRKYSEKMLYFLNFLFNSWRLLRRSGREAACTVFLRIDYVMSHGSTNIESARHPLCLGPYNSHQLTHTTMYWTYIHTKIGPAKGSVMCVTINPWELVAISDSVAFLRSISPVCPPFLPQLLSLPVSHAVLNNCGNAYTSWGTFCWQPSYLPTYACRQFKDALLSSYLPQHA